MSIDYGGVLAERIRSTRQSRGMSQSDLARAMQEQGFSFHQATINRIEDRSREVRVPELFALASALGVEPSVLVEVPSLPSSTSQLRQDFESVARAIVTGQMDERIALAWKVFERSIGGAS